MRIILLFLLLSFLSSATGLERASGIITLHETPRGDANQKLIDNLLGFFPEQVRKQYTHSILGLRSCLGSNSLWKKNYYSTMLDRYINLEDPHSKWFLCAQIAENKPDQYNFFALEEGSGNKFMRFYVTPEQCELEAVYFPILSQSQEALKTKIYCAGNDSIAQHDWINQKWKVFNLHKHTVQELAEFDARLTYEFKN